MILTGIVFTIVGFGLGLIIYRYSGLTHHREKLLQQQIQERDQHLYKQQQNIRLHFAELAEHLGELSESYQKVYDNLALSAQRLNTDWKPKRYQPSSTDHALPPHFDPTLPYQESVTPAHPSSAQTTDATHPAPPKDYAENPEVSTPSSA